MIAAFDVHYLENRCAAAAILFSDYSDAEPAATYTQLLPRAADYIPGEFFRRELPCILTLLTHITQALDEMIVDGYVMLGNKPGLGMYLFKSLDWAMIEGRSNDRGLTEGRSFKMTEGRSFKIQ